MPRRAAPKAKKSAPKKQSKSTAPKAATAAAAAAAAMDNNSLGNILMGGSGMIAQRAAEPRNASLSSSTLSALSAKQMDLLWERFNSKEVRTDENFEIWPDIAEKKQQKQTKETTEKATVQVNDDDDNDNNNDNDEKPIIIDYTSDEEKTLEDVVYPENLMPSVSDRSLDDVLGVPKGEDGNPSLLSRIMDPDSGGKGKNKTGLHGLIAQPKKELSVRERYRQRQKAMQKQRSGMTADQLVYDKRGRVVRGARQVSEEDMRSGAVRSAQVDPKATKDAIRANIEKMRAEMAAKKAESSLTATSSNE